LNRGDSLMPGGAQVVLVSDRRALRYVRHSVRGN
jgi:hypothetical protein